MTCTSVLSASLCRAASCLSSGSLSPCAVSRNLRHSQLHLYYRDSQNLASPLHCPPPPSISISHSPLLLSQPFHLYRIYTSHMVYLVSSFLLSPLHLLPSFLLSSWAVSADLSNQHNQLHAHTQPISTLINTHSPAPFPPLCLSHTCWVSVECFYGAWEVLRGGTCKTAGAWSV